jgi:membrane protease subunit HflC
MPAGGGRTKMLSRVFELSAPELRETFGIGLIDVDIKHLNYTESAQAATIRQMISEREKVAARYEAEGRREARTLQGQTEELVSRLRGESTRERLQLEGLAEAESARLRSLAYGADPELYAYMKQLEVIQAGLSEGTRFVLSADTPLLSLLEDPSAQAPAVPPNPANIEALMKEVETTANIPLLVDPEAENLEK